MNDWLPPLRDGWIVLIVAVGVYIVVVALAHLLGRARGIRFTPAYHAFAASVGLLAGVHASEWPLPVRAMLLQHLTAAAILTAVIPLVTLLNRALWTTRDKRGDRVEAPQVLADLTAVLVLVLAVLATLQFVYDVQVPGLLAGSGIAALVLGLGMQNVLQNLFAGVSLHLGKPFKTGDWLLIDGQHAKVIGISSRATRLLTTDDVVIEVGNSEILKQTVTNFHEPHRRHAVRATIGLHYSAPPARVQQVLKEAALSVTGVCPQPEPVVFVADFADSAIVYEIKVWIDDHAIMGRVLSDVRSHCWYAVNRAGIEIPYPQLTVHRAARADPGARARTAARGALAGHPIFGFLPPGQIDELLGKSAVLAFAPTEQIIEQGAAGESLFLLVGGEVEVRLRRGDGVAPVAKLGPGECFGEMSLLAGEPRNATVVALTEVEAVEIAKPVTATRVTIVPPLEQCDWLDLVDTDIRRRRAVRAFLALPGAVRQRAECNPLHRRGSVTSRLVFRVPGVPSPRCWLGRQPR